MSGKNMSTWKCPDPQGMGGRPCETNTLQRINDLDCVSALLLADKPLSSSRDDTPITDIDGNRKRDYSV